MIGSEIKEFTEIILGTGETLGDDEFYPLLNVAKTNLEEERPWRFLIKLDSSKTANSGNNPDTAINLPTDFAEDRHLYVGTGFGEFFPVDFEEQHRFRNASHRYVIDIANMTYYLLGNIVGGTTYLYYKRFTPDLDASTSPVFPDRFHKLLAFMVAGYHQLGVDADDIFARMGPVNKNEALLIKASMSKWDANLASRSQNDRLSMGESGTGEFPLDQM